MRFDALGRCRPAQGTDDGEHAGRDHAGEADEGEERDDGDADPAHELDHEVRLGTSGRGSQANRRTRAITAVRLAADRRTARPGRAAPRARRGPPVLGDVEHGDGLVAAGGGGDERGETGAALEPGGAEVPADHVVDLEDPAAADDASRSGRRGGRRPARGRGSGRGRGRAAPRAGAPSRPASSHAGARERPPRRAAAGDDAGRGAAPGSSGAVRPRGPCGTRAASTGSAVSSTSRATRSTTAAGAGGTSVELPCWLRSRPVTMAESRAPRASAQAERLGEVDAGHPVVVQRGLAGGEQPAGQVPGRAAPAGCGSAGSPSW